MRNTITHSLLLTAWYLNDKIHFEKKNYRYKTQIYYHSCFATICINPLRDSAQKPLKIWAVWSVFQQDLSGLGGFFFGKTAQTAQILLKKTAQKPLISCGDFWTVFQARFDMWPWVDLHKPKVLILRFSTPKMLIIQLPASNVWKIANHTIFIQFRKTIEKRFNLVSPTIWTKYNSLGMKNNYVWFLKKMVIIQFPYMKKCLSVNFHLWKNAYPRVFFTIFWVYETVGNCRISIFSYMDFVG